MRREDNQVTVDTRTVDMNVDRFDARYDDLASTKNTENRRKPTPQGNKQKFTQRGQRQRQQFQKGKRETEFERLQRIQLEKARNAQLKVMIPDEITVGELAARLKQQAGKVIAKFMQMGEMHAINDVIDFDTAALLAEEFHAKVEHEVHVTIEERLFTQEEDAQEDLVERPPRRRGRRHHAGHRCISGQGQRQPHHLPGYPGPRGVHLHACPRCQHDRYCSSGGCCR